jgi:hypothetical protein
MRIFLSPLFFRQRFCKHCVRRIYQEDPDAWWWQHEVARMPPLGRFEAGSGFVPDLSVLLMFDEFLIDAEAHEKILSTSPPIWLRHWSRVLEILGSEGALSVADTDEDVKRVAAIRGAMLKRDMREPAKWADALGYHDNLMNQADSALGELVNAAGNFIWKFDPGWTPSVGEPDKLIAHTLHGSLKVPSDDPNDIHYQLKEEALSKVRSQLQELNAGLAVSKLLDVAPMFWAPYKRYLATKSTEAEKALEAQERAQAARLFFSVAFPRYKPESLGEMSRMRQDKRLRQLRDEIITASTTGDLLDPAYPQRVLEEVLKVEKKVGRVRKISGWISSAVGMTPVPGTGIAANLASELISRRAESRIRKDWSWFYLISDGTGYS